MADDLKFSEDGMQIHASLAKMLDEEFKAQEGMTIAPFSLTMGGVIGVAAFAIAVIRFMTSGDDREMVEAMKNLQRQIDEIKRFLVMLDRRIDELVNQVAIESNRQTLRDLLDYLDSSRQLAIELTDQPRDADTAVRVANEAGILCDKFLRSNFEIWRWTDVVLDASGQNALAPLRFKNMPTLPVYVAAILIWLTARERVVKAGQKHRLVDDQARLERHRFATSVRIEFDKYHIDNPTIARDDDYGTPLTIAENIKYRIRAYPTASTTYAVNRICQFYFDVGNMMTGERKSGPGFDLLMPEGTVLCTLDPNMIGSPDIEIEMETAAGIDTLYELFKILERLARGGSLRGQFIGVFPPTTKTNPRAILYFIAQNAELHWYCNDPGGSASWQGPLKIGNGWGGFTTVFSGGGVAIYAVRPNGDLLWYGHDGCYDGSPRWRGPHQVGHSWQGFQSIFSGGEYVVYGIQPNGDLLWYRHHGAPSGSGVTTWSGPVRVGWGWAHFAKVFSSGGGVIYAIRQDGMLLRYKHLGYLNGTLDWESYTDTIVVGAQARQYKEIGTGWNEFREVLAVEGDMIYAFTQDGRILWYRYGKPQPQPPKPPKNPIGSSEIIPRDDLFYAAHKQSEPGSSEIIPRDDLFYEAHTQPEPGYSEIIPLDIITQNEERLRGPVEIKHNLPNFRSVFSLMADPFRAPG
jgi:hypothetical protein